MANKITNTMIEIESNTGTKNRILIVDDSKFALKVLRDVLIKENYQIVAEARNGYECIELAEVHKPDYVFLDVEMPLMDGISALSKILEVNPSCYVIMCTAMGQQDIIEKSLRTGAKDYVLKPYKRENIVSVMNAAAKACVQQQVLPSKRGFPTGKAKSEKIQNPTIINEEVTMNKELVQPSATEKVEYHSNGEKLFKETNENFQRNVEKNWIEENIKEKVSELYHNDDTRPNTSIDSLSNEGYVVSEQDAESTSEKLPTLDGIETVFSELDALVADSDLQEVLTLNIDNVTEAKNIMVEMSEKTIKETNEETNQETVEDISREILDETTKETKEILEEISKETEEETQNILEETSVETEVESKNILEETSTSKEVEEESKEILEKTGEETEEESQEILEKISLGTEIESNDILEETNQEKKVEACEKNNSRVGPNKLESYDLISPNLEKKELVKTKNKQKKEILNTDTKFTSTINPLSNLVHMTFDDEGFLKREESEPKENLGVEFVWNNKIFYNSKLKVAYTHKYKKILCGEIFHFENYLHTASNQEEKILNAIIHSIYIGNKCLSDVRLNQMIVKPSQNIIRSSGIMNTLKRLKMKEITMSEELSKKPEQENLCSSLLQAITKLLDSKI